MYSPPIEMIVTDLDGTLWTNHAVPDDTRAALAQLERRNIPVLAATGRRLRSARLALIEAGLAHIPCVGLNGALAADCGEVFHSAPFATADARAVFELFVAGGIPPVSYLVPERDGDSIDAVVVEGVSTHPEHLAVLAPTLSAAPIDFSAIVAFSVLGVPFASLHPIRTNVETQCAADCVLSPDHAYGAHNLAVTARGVSKWSGVLAYCARHNIDPTRVLTIGDDDNDATMLAQATVGLAMRHASPMAVAAADVVVDRWTQLLDYL